MATAIHDSDCAVHNAPALPVGPRDCGATTEGKWADIHSPTCPAVAVTTKIEELIRYNCRAVEGWPVTIEGVEEAAAAIYAFLCTGIKGARE